MLMPKSCAYQCLVEITHRGWNYPLRAHTHWNVVEETLRQLRKRKETSRTTLVGYMALS